MGQGKWSLIEAEKLTKVSEIDVLNLGTMA